MADQEPIGAEKTLASEVRSITDGASLPANPKRVVRTYAADVAKLTGAPTSVSSLPATPKPKAPVSPHIQRPPQPAPRPAAIPKPAPVSLAETVSKINLIEPPAPPTPHLPPLQKPLPPPTLPPAKPPTASPSGEWERIVEKKESSFLSKLFWSLFGSKSEPAPQPRPLITSTPVWQKTSQPSVSEPSAPSFKPAPAIASDMQEREAVLARLRSRVSTYQAQNPAPPPVFPTPRPEPAARPAPAYVPQPSAPQPAVPERLHTYTGDFSNRIDTTQASAFSVYAAQADAGGAVSSSAGPKKQHAGLAYTLGAAALFIGGSLVLYFGYAYFAGNQPVAVVNTAPPTLIVGDDQTSINGTGNSLMTNLATAASAGVPTGSARIVYYAASATTTAPGGALIRALNLSAPDILLRNIGENSTVGILHSGDDSRVFFVLAATSYERTFAGMLSWEGTIGNDLALLYPPYADAPVPTATTGTTTSTLPPPVSIPPSAPRFIDEVVSSHDVRALKDAEGRTILLYGFRDQQTLLIARDETAFSILLARLSATRTQ